MGEEGKLADIQIMVSPQDRVKLAPARLK